jgi:hypothetical protein
MRKYEEHWNYLKGNIEAEWGINTQADSRSCLKYFNTFKKALQKEKHLDIEFRENCPNATLIFEMRDTTKSTTGKSVYAKLDRAFSLQNLTLLTDKVEI